MSLDSRVVLFLLIGISSFLYSLLYVFRDIYYATENFRMKKCVNKILPFLTKYNTFFLILTFILLLVFYLINFYQIFILLLIFIILFNLIFIYFPINDIVSTPYLRILSYILIFSITLLFIFQLINN